MSLHGRRSSGPGAKGLRGVRRVRRQWIAVLWLAAVWCLLWGSFTAANLLGGALVGAVVVAMLPLPDLAFHGRVRPLAVLALLARFFVDLTVASFQVAMLALRPGVMPRGAVVGVRLRNPSDLYLTVTAELSSLVPGSLVVEVHRLTGMVYVHILDLEAYGGIDKARADVLALEARVLRALASDDELAAVGLSRRRTSMTAGGPS